jgi:RNA polymerase sigma-70 factor (ECF subfamily)
VAAPAAATDAARPDEVVSDEPSSPPLADVSAEWRRNRRARGGVGTTMSDDLEELVAAAKAGDRGAFDALVRATYVETYTLAHRLTGDDDDARDVTQEAYLRAFRGLRRFRGDAQFTTWLYRITANCASTHLGRRARHRHEELHDDLPVGDLRPGHDPVGRAEHGALRERVNLALRDLPPRLRAVIVLRDIYDLPHEAIAAELGISEAAAKVRLHRARRKLRDDVFLREAAIDEGAARAV